LSNLVARDNQRNAGNQIPDESRAQAKLAAFIWTGVDMQWRHQLWLLPCAAVGHLMGLRFHEYTLQADTKIFFRVLGIGLLAVSISGLVRLL
jgi:hypothetical protein